MLFALFVVLVLAGLQLDEEYRWALRFLLGLQLLLG
jgi:hypothetical protein